MKQRAFNILLTVLFCLFIGGMFLGSLILPDRDFSQLENRKLAQTPALSLENITTGKFMEDAEDYVNDGDAVVAAADAAADRMCSAPHRVRPAWR